jgi:hypothetical protein
MAGFGGTVAQADRQPSKSSAKRKRRSIGLNRHDANGHLVARDRPIIIK